MLKMPDCDENYAGLFRIEEGSGFGAIADNSFKSSTQMGKVVSNVCQMLAMTEVTFTHLLSELSGLAQFALTTPFLSEDAFRHV